MLFFIYHIFSSDVFWKLQISEVVWNFGYFVNLSLMLEEIERTVNFGPQLVVHIASISIVQKLFDWSNAWNCHLKFPVAARRKQKGSVSDSFYLHTSHGCFIEKGDVCLCDWNKMIITFTLYIFIYLLNKFIQGSLLR